MTEEEIYKYYSNKNPNKGKKITLEDVTKSNITSFSKKSTRLLLIPNWISGEKDKYYLYFSKSRNCFKKV